MSNEENNEQSSLINETDLMAVNLAKTRMTFRTEKLDKQFEIVLTEALMLYVIRVGQMYEKAQAQTIITGIMGMHAGGPGQNEEADQATSDAMSTLSKLIIAIHLAVAVKEDLKSIIPVWAEKWTEDALHTLKESEAAKKQQVSPTARAQMEEAEANMLAQRAKGAH